MMEFLFGFEKFENPINGNIIGNPGISPITKVLNWMTFIYFDEFSIYMGRLLIIIIKI